MKAPAAKKAAPKKTPAVKAAPRPRKAPAKLAAAGAPQAPAGWYPDPDDPNLSRYWTGTAWTGTGVVPDDGDHTTPPNGLPPSTAVTPVAAAEGGTPLQTTIVWHGRQLAVRFPNEGQIVVWRRVARQFQGLTREQLIAMGDEKVGRMLDRGVSVVFSVLVDGADKDWVEDGLLENEWTLSEASEIIPLSLEALNAKAAEQNGGATPAPAKAARRNTSRARAR